MELREVRENIHLFLCYMSEERDGALSVRGSVVENVSPRPDGLGV